jgi:triacylglycerol esterase/lipase EstA (alpha/beta hydrolase family)
MLTEKMPISDQQSNMARRELNDNTGTPIVLVHGITGWANGSGLGPWAYNSSAGSNCDTNYWGTTISYLNNQGYSDIRTVQYYTGDTNCDVNLHDPKILDQSLCDNFSPGNEGTNNEDLNHVSCLLAQYLNQNFAGGQNVILVGHSMGGIIIRNTMYLAETQGGQQGMPSDIGYVTDAVTFNTPHAGVSATVEGGPLVCGYCTQITQLTSVNSFMEELTANAQNPQTSAGFTQWTVVGSECDQVVNEPGNPDGAAGAVAMQASHAIMYSQSDSATCYSHTSALGDSSTANDAWLYSCDTNDPTGNPCGTDYQDLANNWIQEINTGAHGLQTLYEAVGR